MSNQFDGIRFEQSFDIFSRLEKPSITLCNPDKTQLHSLNACYNTELKLKWNAQSEFSFVFPRTANDTTLDGFDYIEGKRLVLIENIGYFIINEVEDSFDGSVPIKNVTCFSQESELVYKKIILFSGTYNMSDLMDQVLSVAFGWSVAYIDSSLSGSSRTFNVSDTNVYQFLTNDVSIAFDCVFVFDYFDKEISIIPSSYAVRETDVFLSFENLIKSTDYQEITSEITTVMYPYGGGDLTIRNVNPLGTNAIYNFTYYKTPSWMSASLISAIDTWEAKIDDRRTEYAEWLVTLSQYSGSLLLYEAQLAEFQSDLVAYQQVRAVRVQQGLDTTEVDADIAETEQVILNQNVLIDATNETIDEINLELSDINDYLSISTNFPGSLYAELSSFIFENTYRNDNIITTDSMSFSEIQDQSQQLYDIAVDVLEKASVPRYEITINSINFLALQEYQIFIDQLGLGDQITVDSGRGYFIDATLLEYDFSYDNLESFTIILSNRKRLDNSSFIFTDLFGQSIQSATSLGFNSSNWNDWSNSKSTVLNNVITPNGSIEYGIVATNIKGTIDANSDLAITNTNSTTGSSNFSLDHNGLVIRDASFYSGSNVGVDGDLSMAGGGAIFFKGGIFVGGAGLEPGSNVITMEDVTSQVTTGGSYFTVSGTYLANSLRVYLNGIMQRRGYNFVENGNVTSFTMYDTTESNDVLVVEYVDLA